MIDFKWGDTMHSNDTMERIKQQISKNPVLLYMKGTPDFPMCGFSGRVVQLLDNLNAQYAYVNILENPEIRSILPSYAKWPTFPQFYIQGELVGGCDILVDLQQTGELQRLLDTAGALLPLKAARSAAVE